MQRNFWSKNGAVANKSVAGGGWKVYQDELQEKEEQLKRMETEKEALEQKARKLHRQRKHCAVR